MMAHLVDPEMLRTELQSRLGLSMVSDTAILDGGTYQAVRPSDLERGHGFFVALARTPRQITASVHFDAYAGRLLRLMSEADDASQSAMRNLVEGAGRAGLTAYCVMEGGDSPITPQLTKHWKTLEVEVAVRLPPKCQPAKLQRLAADVASYAAAIPLCLIEVEEISDTNPGKGLPEGAKTRIEVNRYERSPANRAACIAHHGTRCNGCGFDFEEHYGAIASGFIEVHHITPVSQMGSSYAIDPTRDLIPLCSNCHSVVHRTSPPLSLVDLHALIKAGIAPSLI